MLETLKLKTNTIYVLSGLHGSGKSTFLKENVRMNNIEKNMIISTCKIREKIVGKKISLHKDVFYDSESVEVDETISKIVEQVLAGKAKENLICFVDSLNLREIDRIMLMRLAKKYNMDTEILIFNESLDICAQRNIENNKYVSQDTMEKHNEIFERKSLIKHHYVNSNTKIELIPKDSIDVNNIDIIGDVHGLYDEMLMLVKKLGYSIEDGIMKHPEGRKILFLGDIVDRGLKSIEVLKFVYKNVKAGHYAVQGNHEIKLINNYYKYKNNELASGSKAVLKTFIDFLYQIPEKSRDEYIRWLEVLPTYYVISSNKKDVADFVCLHGNVIDFNPLHSLRSDILYGSTRVYQNVTKDTDKAYQTLFNKGVNKYTLIRGHIPQISKQKNVISLEEEQCFEGYLTCLRLDKYIKTKNLENSIVRQKTNFNYNKIKNNTSLYNKLEDLRSKRYVISNTDITKTLKIYKYNQKMNLAGLWSKEKYLSKANGLVIDMNGNIVQNPFNVITKYSKDKEIISDSSLVEAVEKPIGLQSCISKHPFKNELLITVDGEFESSFVEHVRDMIIPKLKYNLLRYFSLNGNLTLMFSVGRELVLVGAKGLDIRDKEHTEESLDKIGKILSLKRPNHSIVKFETVKEAVASGEKAFLIREANSKEILFSIDFTYNRS